MELTLTDADLARLEELAKASGDTDYLTECDDPEMQYIAAACNAAPALVAEVRRLRAELAEIKKGDFR